MIYLCFVNVIFVMNFLRLNISVQDFAVRNVGRKTIETNMELIELYYRLQFELQTGVKENDLIIGL